MEDEDTEELFIVRFKVTTLSHPRSLVPIQVYIPVVVYVVPFQRRLSHDVIDSDEDELLIVRFNKTVLSHPKALVPVQEYDPEDVYVVPFQCKLSHDDTDTV